MRIIEPHKNQQAIIAAIDAYQSSAEVERVNPHKGISEELKALLEKTRHHVMTPNERFEQRVSFIYGQQDYDVPGKSKSEIRKMLIDLQGCPAKSSTYTDGI